LVLELDHAHTLFGLLLLSLILFYLFTSHGKGPYYAEFHLQFPDRSGIDSIVVEFPSRKELPHSVFTFITLIDSQLYDDTSILSKGVDGALRIGASPENMALLSQRYKALGYGKSALSFIESSLSFPCKRHSVGFDGRGPAMKIHISDRNVDDQDRTCMGRVVQGMDVLARVETSIEKKQVVDIVKVRHVQVHDVSRREL
jgi:cyclophilin family peptidyl-prolyl cis-trans isomerase